MNKHTVNWLEVSPRLLDVAEAVYSTLADTCPPRDRVLRAFEYFSPEETRIVILGQDPYHTLGKASGLAFGYHPEYTGPIDSSLVNIIRELRSEYEPGVALELFISRFDTTLESWAAQGVLLLNTRLTVETGKPLSHAGMGWEECVSDVLSWLAEQTECIFMLWGREAFLAVEKLPVVGDRIIRSSHPCSFSAHRGFLGSGQFRTVEKLLETQGKHINWINHEGGSK